MTEISHRSTFAVYTISLRETFELCKKNDLPNNVHSSGGRVLCEYIYIFCVNSHLESTGNYLKSNSTFDKVQTDESAMAVRGVGGVCGMKYIRKV